MDCWSLLQLTVDADARTIKRSYARLLKSCRPDEDAEGFQRLREAYEEALGIAQWRAEQAQDSESETATALIENVRQEHHGNLNAWSEVLDLQPLSLQRPTPALPQADITARALLDGLTEENLDQRWHQAQQQQCSQAFEQLLLQLCFDHPGLRSSIAGWAAQNLDWLAPWQNVQMNEWQQEALASSLLQDYRQALRERLESSQEREFLNQLKHYTAQPWLQVFDRRQEWQRVILQLFNDTEWSLPLFDRVGQVFGWDDKKGIHPEPAATWQALIERCNQEAFYQNLQAKAEQNRTWAADVQAAHLLMKPLPPPQQKKMIDGFGQNEWQACHDLAQTLKWRYPALLARLPSADVFFWRRFFPRPIAPQTWVRVWAAIALALYLFYLPSEHKSLGFSIAIPMVFACVPVWFFRFALSWWVPITSHVIVQDLWLTERVIPQRLNPDTRWLLIRHGVPQAVMLLLFAVLQGWLGLVTYVGFMLIGFLHKRRIGQLDPELAERRPWLTALHWAHFSPLQLAFLVVMIGINLVCQLYYPQLQLTRITPG
ncbi:hypothetical protein ACQR3P_17480 [Rhodococcus sp. IEGM1300]